VNVGTRELKNRLSHYLRRVREDGESVYVTDHGKVVAELRPVSQTRARKSDRQVLLDLIAKGDVSSGGGNFKKFQPVKVRKRISISRLVIEGRG
jgi:prevent-host-death family protein